MLPLIVTLAQQASTVPASRPDEWWQARHRACVEATKARRFEVAFLGDSITQGWDSAGKEVWDASLAPLKAANFGFSGDRTEHVLWRLDNGEVIGANPKVVVLMIGTNNLGTGQTPEAAADGIVAIVDALLKRARARVLLLAVFPRSLSATDPLRAAVQRTNEMVWRRVDDERVTKLDIGGAFVRSDGSLRSLLMPDALHLNASGYGIWARAMLPALMDLLAEPVKG